jgi:hypothetical protein
LITGENKTVNTNVPDPKEQQPSKDESSGEVLSDQGKTEGNIPSNQVIQGNPDHPSNKKMTAQEWGSKFVHIHQERTARKIKAQEFTCPESLKERLIQEGKSHLDPKDPRFPQYFKNKAIKSSPQEQEGNISGDSVGGDSKDIVETPPITIPHPEVTPKRARGLCTTLSNIFSPGGTKPKDSPSSESSATYVDPDLVKGP